MVLYECVSSICFFLTIGKNNKTDFLSITVRYNALTFNSAKCDKRCYIYVTLDQVPRELKKLRVYFLISNYMQLSFK